MGVVVGDDHTVQLLVRHVFSQSVQSGELTIDMSEHSVMCYVVYKVYNVCNICNVLYNALYNVLYNAIITLYSNTLIH